MITIICFVVKINQINKGGWNNSAIQSRSSSILHEKETDRYGRTNATDDHYYRVRRRRKEEHKRDGKPERKE